MFDSFLHRPGSYGGVRQRRAGARLNVGHFQLGTFPGQQSAKS
jgi:hypothetical protein